jgi:hypothetical protein
VPPGRGVGVKSMGGARRWSICEEAFSSAASRSDLDGNVKLSFPVNLWGRARPCRGGVSKYVRLSSAGGEDRVIP